MTGSGAFAIVLLDSDKLLEEELTVWSVVLFERRRLNSAWKDAIDDRRRSELRREAVCESLDSFLREGMMSFVLAVKKVELEKLR